MESRASRDQGLACLPNKAVKQTAIRAVGSRRSPLVGPRGRISAVLDGVTPVAPLKGSGRTCRINALAYDAVACLRKSPRIYSSNVIRFEWPGAKWDAS